VQPLQSNLPLGLSANGNVAAWQEASVGSESNALKLSEVFVNVGDFVKKDQLLATFDNQTVMADVALAKAGLAEALASSADARSNAERARTLQSTGALSTQQINQFLTTELAAAAHVDSARATLQQQELRLKNTRVLAPDSGVISARSATVGAVVGAGTELFRLIRQGRLEWRAEVTSSELARIKIGTAVTIAAPWGASVEGKVRMVGPTVDVQTRNALVYVDIKPATRSAPDPAGGSLKAGMYARGEFVLGSTNALTVPQEAVVVRDGFSYLFKVGTDNKVVQQRVQTGRRTGNLVEITQGIAAGTTVALTGAGFLNDGDTVRVNNATK
jgi:RND family efflux transporter MFP subunit